MRQISQTLGWNYVNTGILYRAIAWLAVENGIDLDKQEQLLELVGKASDRLSWNADSQSLHYANSDITSELFSDEVGQAASVIAKQASLRTALPLPSKTAGFSFEKTSYSGWKRHRNRRFPDADLKIFLTASIEERAKRRLAQFDDEKRLT